MAMDEQRPARQLQLAGVGGAAGEDPLQAFSRSVSGLRLAAGARYGERMPEIV
jgi:hypothetical protein